MPHAVAEPLAIVLLLGVLAFAVLQPRQLPEAVGAVPAAALLVLLGAVSLSSALTEIRALAPTVGFLAAVLVLASLCDEEGLFSASGRLIARASRGRPQRLLGLVFAAAAVTTAVLSLDATVVLLTPVVFVTATTIGARPKPHVYACTHLANSASLLLPVSNLTNLIAFAALRSAGVSFGRFGLLMALPWLVVLAVEYVVSRRFFATDLAVPATDVPGEPVALPRFALVVVVLTLLGFAASSPLHIDPAWVATAGALVLAVRAFIRRRTTVSKVVASASIPFLAFVLALGVVVAAVERNGLGTLVQHTLPTGETLWALLAVAVVAAVLANLVNNLPAILVMLPTLAASGHPGPVLAALIGVNVGPNLTYVGSLATLLWRRILRQRDAEPSLAEFLRLGALTVPPALIGAVVALWAGLLVFGGSHK